ncbi:hypothetical protein MNBD_GAMMA12-156 [hydrothermal vent metagenome]|uniref:Uncharacterized protein n=1 Tax=hydrothermal vent metagenome TaxID=652676 RepID=A0A3B0YZM1_9ZZZZ
MTNINPVSEDFFYWDPEQLANYQATERSGSANEMNGLAITFSVDASVKKTQGKIERFTALAINSTDRY